MGALSNKGGREQRNREEIGAEAIFLAASPLVLARFAATPLLRPARQNRHATQAINLNAERTSVQMNKNKGPDQGKCSIAVKSSGATQRKNV